MTSTYARKGVTTWLGIILLGCLLCAAPLAAQDDESEGDTEDGNITVDFVQKDIHTVMHYIGLRADLKIIVEGTVSVNLTVIFRDVDPKDAIKSICKANKLDYVEDGEVIIIKQRQQSAQLANVTESEVDGRFNVNFESHELVAAIMEVARVTETQVFMPSLTTPEEGDDGPVDPDQEQEREDRAIRVQERLVSMYMRNAAPESILQRLEVLGALRMKELDLDGNVGYEYSYPPTLSPRGGEANPLRDGDVVIVSEDWELIGADVNQIKGEVQNLLSPYGKVVSEESTGYLVVFDTQEQLMEVSTFLDPLQTRVGESHAAASRDVDWVVREYRVMRDVESAGQEIVSAITELLSEDGSIVANPDRNSLVVYETADRIENIDKIMTMLDTAPEQVLITAKLVEVTLDDYIGYGLEIFTNHSADNLNDGRFTGGSEDTAQGTVGGLYGQPTGFDPFFATFSNPRVDVRLELLANEGRVETLSAPTQMVSNKMPARIEVGQEVPYLEQSTATGGSTTASVAFKEVAIVMDVTPTVLEGGLIRLDVTVTVREVIGNVAIEGNNTPILSKRESKTNVFIHDGETLVMGGMMRERERLQENGLPFLKDIPFLGYLFKSANRTTSKTDLLFFLRPQIVTAGNRSQIGKDGLEVERDERPLLYDKEDAKHANIREGRYRLRGIAPKPRYYNEKTRPKKTTDVKPGA